jgi:hypothetical protein
MSSINFLFKIVENDEKNKQIGIKYCVQNSKRSINEVPTLMVDYDNLDFGTYENLIKSIFRCGTDIALDNLSKDEIVKDNIQSPIHDGVNSLDELVNKTMVMSDIEIKSNYSRLKKIDLDNL